MSENDARKSFSEQCDDFVAWMRHDGADQPDGPPPPDFPTPPFFKSALFWLLCASVFALVAGRFLPAEMARNLQYLTFGCFTLYLALRFFKTFVAVAILLILVKFVFRPSITIITRPYENPPHSAGIPAKK